jgi:CRISPR-associated protein Cmr3
MSTRLALKLEPLDTLFFRDGRPFAPATRAEGGLPQPRTLAGALRTRLVSQFIDLGRLPELRRGGVPIEEALTQLGCPSWVLRLRFRGPWLARQTNGLLEPLIPAPVVLSRDGDELFRLEPLESNELPGWSGRHGLCPLWRAGGAEAKPAGGFLTRGGLETFLAGGTPTSSDLVPAEKLYGFDDRTGLAIAPDTLTGIEGMLYGIRLLALERGVFLYAEVLSDTDRPDLARLLEGPLPMGGEGRHVRVRPLAGSCEWPEVPPGKRSLWLLASPAPLRQAHRPEGLPDGVTVTAAATGTPVAFSGWDVARNGPEKTRFAVPAGSVYFVDGEFAPDQCSLCAAADAAVGWGFALRGTWK